MKEFGKKEYKQTAYINFESSRPLNTLFADDYDIDRIIVVTSDPPGLLLRDKFVSKKRVNDA